MALLLGSGSLEDRAWIMFDASDPEMTGQATKNGFTSFLDDLIFVATEVIPIAAVGKEDY